jgi:acyl carrier protein
MITNELKTTLLAALKLKDWDISDETLASEIPGWDSLNHLNVIIAVEQHFGVRFKNFEVLKLKNIGELQRLLNSKLQKSVNSQTI